MRKYATGTARLVLSFAIAMTCIALALTYPYPAAASTQSCDAECQAQEHADVQACVNERTACYAGCNGNGPCIQQCASDYILCKEDAYDTYTTCVAGCS